MVYESVDEDEKRQHWDNPLSHTLLSVVVEWRTARLSLHTVFEGLRQSECQDARDRIYGLVALIDWRAVGMNPIFPDYSRSTWSLAVELAAGVYEINYLGVLEMINIDANAPEVLALMQQRISPSFPVPTRQSVFRDALAMRLSDELGMLSCALEHTLDRGADQSLDVAELLLPLHLLASPEYSWCKTNGRQPQKVYSNAGDLVALVCGQSRPGDVLVHQNDFRGMLHKCLVLCPTHNTSLEVIGNGILLRNTGVGHAAFNQLPTMKEGTLPQDDIFRAQLRLTATPEVILLFYLGVEEGTKRSRNPHMEVLHLMSRAVVEMQGAATLLRSDNGDDSSSQPDGNIVSFES